MYLFTGLKYERVVNEAHMKGVVVGMWLTALVLTLCYACDLFTTWFAGTVLEIVFLFGLLTWFFNQCQGGASNMTLAPPKVDPHGSCVSYSLFKSAFFVCALSASLFFLVYRSFYGSMFVAYFYFFIMAVNLATHPILYMFWNTELRRLAWDIVGCLVPHRLACLCSGRSQSPKPSPGAPKIDVQ